MLSQKVVNGYLVHNVINVGGRSEIYECVNLLDTKKYALKLVRYNLEFDNDINNESTILSKLTHDNILHSIEDFTYYFENDKYHVFILPLHEADLQSVKIYRLEYKDKMKIISDIVSGIKYLHSLDIYHGDIKPANILVKENKGVITATVADFTLSDNVGTKTGVKNTFPYCSPFDLYNQNYLKTTAQLKALQEACINENVDLEEYFTIDRKIIEEDGKKSDIFALGLTIIYVLLGDSLFCNSCSVLKKKIPKNKANQVNKDFFITKCLAQYLYFLRDPELYLTLWLKDVDLELFELVRSMLSVNPKNRPSIEAVEQALK